MLNRIKRLGKIQKDTDSNFPLIKSLSYFIYHLYNSLGSGMNLTSVQSAARRKIIGGGGAGL